MVGWGTIVKCTTSIHPAMTNSKSGKAWLW